MSYYITDTVVFDYSGSETYSYMLNPLRPYYTEIRRNTIKLSQPMCCCLVKIPNVVTYTDNATLRDAYVFLFFNENLTPISTTFKEHYKSVSGFYNERDSFTVYADRTSSQLKTIDDDDDEEVFGSYNSNRLTKNKVTAESFGNFGFLYDIASLLENNNQYVYSIEGVTVYTRANFNKLESEGSYVLKHDLPLLTDYDSVLKYINTGKYTAPIDYTLYIDGDRFPNYNLNWNPLKSDSESSIISIEFDAIENNPILPTPHFFFREYPYNDGSAKFNWSDIWQELDSKIPIIDNILTNKFTVKIKYVADKNDFSTANDYVSVDLYEKKSISGVLYDNLISPSKTNDTLTVDFGEGKDRDDYYDTDSGENDEHSPTVGYDIGACNLTACYELSVERLNNIAIKLWSEDFFSNILLLNNSPIENILSCKLLPLSLSGIESAVKIGNVDMGINGNRLNSTVIRYNVGNISIPRLSNMGFLNYAPYTTITIFLPFIGFKELNTSDVMGRNISVDYIVDVITGACKCCINVNNYQCYEYDGNCGIDIPLTSSNRSQVEMGYVQSALGVVTNIGSGNYGGAIGEAISGAVQQYHYNSNGSYSPSTGAYEDRTCFIIIDRPQYSEVSNFGHTKGYKCQLTKTIKNLNGFLKTTDNVDLSNISAPKFCKDKILELLSSGVYV